MQTIRIAYLVNEFAYPWRLFYSKLVLQFIYVVFREYKNIHPGQCSIPTKHNKYNRYHWMPGQNPFLLPKKHDFFKFFPSLCSLELLWKQGTFSETESKHDGAKPIVTGSFRRWHMTHLINEM